MSARLIVEGPEGQQAFEVSPRGCVLGRSTKCGGFLPSDRVSRQHARVFRDPFGRWVIEDLQSRNGTWVNGQQVSAHVLLPGDATEIGPFRLRLEQPSLPTIQPDSGSRSSVELVQGEDDEHIVHSRGGEDAVLSRARLKMLNAIIDRLASLPGPDSLYRETCRTLARAPGAAALVLRMEISPGKGAVADQAVVLASQVATEQGLGAAGESVRLSRRVLEAVCTERTAVMAGGPNLASRQLMLTVQDPDRPHTVFCAPVGENEEGLDLLYLDLPTDQAIGDTFEFVQAVAAQVALARRNLLLAQARAEQRVLDHQLLMARDIQTRLTPKDLRLPGLDIAVHYQPATWVGGDYCDLWSLGDGRVAFAVGDVCGKGLPAAMLMTNLHAALRNILEFCPRCDQALTHLNVFLHDHLPEGLFVTLFLGLLAPGDGLLEYANAGHPQPLLVGDRGPQPLGQADNLPLGTDRAWVFKSRSDQLKPGSGILAFTDGITESAAADGTLFGLEGLQQTLSELGRQRADTLVQGVTAAAEAFRQSLPQHDDVTVLALMRNEA